MVDNPTPAVEVAQTNEARRLIEKLAAADIDVSGTAAIGITSADIIAANDWLSSTPSRGGEVEKLREAGKQAARDIRAAMHRSLNSGHKQAHMNYGPLTVCLDQIDAALASPPPMEGLSGEDHLTRAKARAEKRAASGEVTIEGSIYEGMEACLVQHGRTIAHVMRYADAVDLAARLAAPPVEGLTSKQISDYSTALVNLSAYVFDLRSALTLARDLIETIDQSPNNVWSVKADDPETAVCETFAAIEAVLAASSRVEGLNSANGHHPEYLRGIADASRIAEEAVFRAFGKEPDGTPLASFALDMAKRVLSSTVEGPTSINAHEHLREVEPVRITDERGNPGLLYTAQNMIDAFKAGRNSRG